MDRFQQEPKQIPHTYQASKNKNLNQLEKPQQFQSQQSNTNYHFSQQVPLSQVSKQGLNYQRQEQFQEKQSDHVSSQTRLRPAVQKVEHNQQQQSVTEFFQNTQQDKPECLETKVRDLEIQLEEKNQEIIYYKKQQKTSHLEIQRLKNALDQQETNYRKLQSQKHQITPEEKKSMMIAMRIQEKEERAQELRERQIMRDQAAIRYHDFMLEAFQPVHNHDPNYLNTDNMTYEQLLELQDKVGHVSKGLQKEQIKMIQKITLNKNNIRDLSESCPICCSNFQIAEKFRKLKCNHAYHSTCIKQWLLNEKNCPICKLEVQIKT